MEIKSIAEGISHHEYESDTLAKAFEEITGIKVTHEIAREGVIENELYTQIRHDAKEYDIYVNDADHIGYHVREDTALNLTAYMNGEGSDITNPKLDMDDFLNPECGQDYEGNQLMLPDQQFVNLYWFRYDWFTDSDIKQQFNDEYGYELGVPVNWAAYEDIAEFFTNKVNTNGTIDGTQVYGHLDWGCADDYNSLRWRFTDSWLSIAGVGDTGLPNGTPVDEWGIRVENKIPKGASVSRGGALNGPAAYYALNKYLYWLHNYAPSEAVNYRWAEAGPRASRGDIAQRAFHYINWLSDESFHNADSPVTFVLSGSIRGYSMRVFLK